jgi:NADH:ubiquinone oxidoreductase subunit B-like Fe-S oxidoreductase
LAFNIEKSNLNIIVTGAGACRNEILATRSPLYDIQRFGVNFVNRPEDADILVISGFYNEEGVKRLIDIYSRMKLPRWVFACGSCAISGGRFPGFAHIIEEFKKNTGIDMYIPGCPPRPEAFVYAVIKFIKQ